MADWGIRTETSAFSVWLETGVVHIRSKGVAATGAMVDEVVAITRDVVGEAPRPVVFDFRGWPDGGEVAWTALIKNVLTMFTAVALLVAPDRAPQLGSYPEIISRLLVPVGVFTSYGEALDFVLRRADQPPTG